MPMIVLRDIVTDADRKAVVGLRLGPGQDRFVNPVDDILLEAEEEARAMPRMWAVHDADTGALVGFVMISDGIPEPIDDDLLGPYFLWKLLIDHGAQRRGYGTATLDAVVAYVAGRPNAKVLYTTAGRGDGSPYDFYRRYGFADGGYAMWDEDVLTLDLAAWRTSRA
jgi:diamine N-acetyltransferase